MWSQGPLPREERGTERLGLGLRLPSRDPGPDPLSSTPPPTRLVSLFMYVSTTKQKPLIVRVGGMVKNKKDSVLTEFSFLLKSYKSFYHKPLL